MFQEMGRNICKNSVDGGQDWLLGWNRNLSSLAQTEFRATQQLMFSYSQSVPLKKQQIIIQLCLSPLRRPIHMEVSKNDGRV